MSSLEAKGRSDVTWLAIRVGEIDSRRKEKKWRSNRKVASLRTKTEIVEEH